MSLLESVYEKARRAPTRIVLPEGHEPRTLKAAEIVRRERLAEPILLTPETMRDKKEAYAERLYELRQAKGVTREEALRLVEDPMYYGMMMVKCGDADGLVSGAEHSTGDMLRPALQLVKTKKGVRIVSSSFLMECPDPNLGEGGLLVFADCVVNPCPTAEELADIALSTGETAQALCSFDDVRMAFLSFSTKGSARHALVDKVREATELAKARAPAAWKIDGELQLDAALVPEVAALKAKGSPLGGRANILIFPDLQAGNIGYKLVQRIGKATCFAVLQGLDRPCNDLSRGCSVEDIVNTVAMTAVQAGGEGAS